MCWGVKIKFKMKDYSNLSSNTENQEPVMSIVIARLARLSENMEQGMEVAKKKLDMLAMVGDDVLCSETDCAVPAATSITSEIFRLISKLEDSAYKLESINRHLNKIL